MRFAPTSRTAMLLAAGILAASSVPAAASTIRLPPHNPYTGPDGTATMHADTGSSDATRLPGPGPGTLRSRLEPLASACPTVLVGKDGYPVALCTAILGLTPTVHLLDPSSGRSIARFPLARGSSLLGGVYAYLDHRDRLVVVDGDHDLLRIAHRRTASGSWRLYADGSLPLADALPDGDPVIGLSPDWRGRVWFATEGGVVGTADDRSGTVRTYSLPAGEEVANSISTAPVGTAVASTHATYLFTAGADGTPRVAWRRPYDRGPGRKPGQLSWGTGSTPTFFGPATGTEYVTIVDNAEKTVNLLVHRASNGERVCTVPVLKAGGSGSGSENSPIAAGRSVYVASTRGYPYPNQPADWLTGFKGGFTRVDLRRDGSGCDLKWDTVLRSAGVPRLSLGDGLVHTVIRDPLIPNSDAATVLDPYYYAQIAPRTGTVVRKHYLGSGAPYDTLQMAGVNVPGRVVYQGTITGILRISN